MSGTKILLSDRTYKNVEDLVIGDELLSIYIPSLLDLDSPDYLSTWSDSNIDDSLLSTTIVSNIKVSNYYKYYTINNKLNITYEHPILVKRENVWSFQKAENVTVGDIIINSNKELEEIVSITNTEGENVPVYTLDTESLDVYFAENILVHNFGDEGKL